MKLKKLVAITLSAVMCMAALTGCGGKSDSAKKTAKVIEVDLTDEQYAFGVDKDQPDLLKEVNQFVADMKSDGTFDEICNRYFGDGTPVPVKSAAYDESKDQLVVATNAAFEPFEYMDGENYVGIDMEIAKALADKLGKELVIQNMDFDAVCLGRNQELATIDHLCKNLLGFEVEHLGNRGAEDVGIEQSDLVALGSKCHSEVGRYGALAHTALARTDGNDILDMREHLARFGTLCLKGLHLDFHVDGLVHVGMYGRLGCFEHRFHEGVGGFFEDEGETNLHAVNAEVVLHHFGFNEVLAVARVAHGGKGVGDQFGIKGHGERFCAFTGNPAAVCGEEIEGENHRIL